MTQWRSAGGGSAKSLAKRHAVRDYPVVDRSQIQAAFDEVFDRVCRLSRLRRLHARL
jgi:hypothetical protein